jgi:transcriptional regulator with XRE-family HTH domain
VNAVVVEPLRDAPEPTGPAREDRFIGAKLREWRQHNGMTLNHVAQAVELSVGYISQVERGMANPSLETLKRLADALGHTVGELFSNELPAAVTTGYSISKRGQRKRIQYPGSGIMNELLSPDLRHQMEVIWVEAPPGATSGGHPHSHVGEECGIVLAGEMVFWVGEDEVTLVAGDAIYLDSTVPHRWQAGEGEPLQAVWLITPPTF